MTVLFTDASNYRGWNQMPDLGDAEPLERCLAVFDKAEPRGWDELKARHRDDYQNPFNRVTLRLTGSNDTLPTDERLNAYREGQTDAGLESLYFQYGRYLLIACSRPGGQAANLQGIWNPDTQPAWSSEYTININTEMNYWPAEVCALGECTEPLVGLLEEFAVSSSRTARVLYGAAGWTAHHNVDIWRMSTPTDGGAQ